MRRHFYLACGFLSLGLGAIGAFLPLLPTVPFMILAAFCFARSSPALEARLLEHRHFGPHIRRWRERSEEHTSELQSLMRISYAVFCLKKKIYNDIEQEKLSGQRFHR